MILIPPHSRVWVIGRTGAAIEAIVLRCRRSLRSPLQGFVAAIGEPDSIHIIELTLGGAIRLAVHKIYNGCYRTRCGCILLEAPANGRRVIDSVKEGSPGVIHGVVAFHSPRTRQEI